MNDQPTTPKPEASKSPKDGADLSAASCSAFISGGTNPEEDGYFIAVYGGSWRKAFFSSERKEWSEGHAWGVGIQNSGLISPDYWAKVTLQNAELRQSDLSALTKL